LGVISAQLGTLDSAVELLCRAIEINPASDSAFYYLGFAMCEFKQFAAGVECFDKALALNPSHAQAACDRASALVELGQFEDALAGYDQAIGICADYAEAYSYRGSALLALQLTDEAIASFDRSIALEPSAGAYLNRGNAYQAKGQYQAAVASYDAAIALQSNYAMAYSNRSASLKHLHRLEESIASSNQAIAIDPNYPAAHWNRALTYLLKGDLAPGFQGYQWRWEMENFKKIRRTFTQPQWLGTPSIRGKKLLIHGEQGLGDTIQFARYAALVQAAGGHVIWEVEPQLFTLFKSLPGVGTLLRQGDPLPDFDYYCPVMSLPMALGTDLASIPAPFSYLKAGEAKLTQWAEVLGPKTVTRVGLAWSGSPTHQDDHNRSIALSTLLEGLPAGFQYFSLQKDVRVADMAVLGSAQNIQHFGEQLVDFSDTAALCELMDLVISVDTSVAHLSGALGVPTWVLLPHLPDWRWLLEHRDSPWYPSIRLYRQSKARHWDDVLQAVANDLCEFR
jgi:lipoprotein NlpI